MIGLWAAACHTQAYAARRGDSQGLRTLPGQGQLHQSINVENLPTFSSHDLTDRGPATGNGRRSTNESGGCRTS